MAAAMQSVQEGKGLREAARLYNVPVESLRRRVLGTVSIDCQPGPPTILTTEEEDQLCKYIIEMADIGFGLTREDIMQIAYRIVEKTHRKVWLGVGGLRVSRPAIQLSQYKSHSHYHTPVLFVLISQQLKIFLPNWELSMGG